MEESHGAEEPGGLQSMESQTGGHDLVIKQQQQLTRQWDTLPGRKLEPHVQRLCGWKEFFALKELRQSHETRAEAARAR